MKEKIGGFYPFVYKLKGNSALRYLFLKQHEGKEVDVKPSVRTLYIVNVPQCFNIKCLKNLFIKYGAIEKVYIHSKPTSSEEIAQNTSSKFDPPTSELGSKVAYVVFYKPGSLKKVFKENDVMVVHKEEFQSNVGKRKWSNDYNNSFVNAKELEDEIQEFMTAFDKKVEDEKQNEKEKLGEPDDDGWVTVSKFSKKPKIPRIESVSNKLVEKQNAARSKQTVVKFYKNQLRDAKFQQILELRKGFQKDKEQIAMMKARRKFKPF